VTGRRECGRSDYLIFDRGSNLSNEVIDTVKTFGISPK
jgi:hypothetical protein